MPAIVDHDERRSYVCGIAARLIARAGIEGVTIRDVAREANCSTRIVSHYFTNKRELLLLTYREFSNESLEEGEAALASGADLQTSLERLLPLNELGKISWRLWIAFWGKTANDPEFAAEQIKRGRLVHDLVKRMLIDRLGAGVRKDFDWDTEADRLLTAVFGIATQGTFDPEHWTPERQRKLLATEIEVVRQRTRQ